MAERATPLAPSLQGCNAMHWLLKGLVFEANFDASPSSTGPAALAEALRVLLPLAGGADALNARDAEHCTPLWCLRELRPAAAQRTARAAAMVAELVAAGADLLAQQGQERDARTLPEILVRFALGGPGALPAVAPHARCIFMTCRPC